MGKPNGEYLIFIFAYYRPDPSLRMVESPRNLRIGIAVNQPCLENLSMRLVMDMLVNHTLNIAVGIVRHFTFIRPVPLQTLHCL